MLEIFRREELQSIGLENLTCIDDRNLYANLFLCTLYLVIFILICSSQRRDNILRFNLLFGVIGHFVLLKDVNVSTFLSFCSYSQI